MIKMTVPFENDTGNIVRKLARKSLKSEKRRNLMVVIAVALASCLICFSIVMALSTRQIEKNHVEDTYEAVYTGITEEDVSTLKGLDDFSRVGEYYMLAVEPAEQGYNASYIYCDEETMYIARDQMKLLEGRLPQKEDEVVVSRYFLSNYGSDAGIGEKVMLSSESFHGEYTVTGIMEGYKEKEVNGSSILLSKEALKGWSGYDPADYRAYVHFKNEQQMDETELTARSREIAKEYQLEMPIMNLSYMKFYKQPVNVSMLALVAGIAVLVIIGGYVVIQSIFRISINDKIQSYGQLPFHFVHAQRRTPAHSLLFVVVLVMAGRQNKRQLLVCGPHLVQKVHAGTVRQVKITADHQRHFLLDGGPRFIQSGSRFHWIAPAL
jgi:putative ABC transport system permease protein